MTRPSRILIFGNCGTGKTYLAKLLSNKYNLPLISLDDIYWCDDHYRKACSSKWVSRRVKEYAKKNSWVIEGYYTHLLDLTLYRAILIIWLDLKYDLCLKNIQNRGVLTNKYTLSRVFEYYNRKKGTSWVSHHHIFNSFEGCRFRFYNREDITKLIKEP